MQSVACSTVECQESRESSELLRDGETGIEIQSGRCRFHKSVPAASVKGGGVRGKVGAMSDASRRRLMGKFASLDYDCLSFCETPLWFITLTTPEVFWTDQRGVYLALRRFRDRLSYDQVDKGYLGAFVRRELGGKRGMLHYHLVVIGGVFCASSVSKVWTECLRSEVRVRVDVQPCDTPERVAKYLSKYCSKVGYEGKERVSEATGDASPEPVPVASEGAPGDAPLSKAHNVGDTEEGYTGGRWWYVWGSETLPWGEVTTILGDDAKQIAKRLRRIFRRWLVEKAVARTVAQANAKLGPDCHLFDTFMVNKSRRWIEERVPFAAFLRRSAGGFTMLVSPELLQKMLDAACIACAGALEVPA